MDRKRITGSVCLLMFLGLSISGMLKAREIDNGFPVLCGDYLGLDKPGLKPEVFAQGIVSTDKNELNAAFSPDQNEFFFSIDTLEKGYVMMHMKQINGKWTKPQTAWFSGHYSDVDPSFSPEGEQLFFSSHRPIPGSNQPGNMDVWIMDRLSSGWSLPYNAGPVINSPAGEVHPVITRNRTLYYASGRLGSKGGKDLYRSRRIKGCFSESENLGPVINSPYADSDCYISPDETFLIFCSNRPGGFGKVDLYISFLKENGAWSEVQNMGKEINTNEIEYAPVVSPDGKYLFFARKGTSQPGGGDIYWVDAVVIHRLQPESFQN